MVDTLITRFGRLSSPIAELHVRAAPSLVMIDLGLTRMLT